MMKDLIEFAKIMQETDAEYERALQTRSSYLKEIMTSSLPPKIKENILEYEEDKIEIIVKKSMLKKMRQLSDEFSPELKKESEKVERSMKGIRKIYKKDGFFVETPREAMSELK